MGVDGRVVIALVLKTNALGAQGFESPSTLTFIDSKLSIVEI